MTATYENYYNANKYFPNFETNRVYNISSLVEDPENYMDSLKNKYNMLLPETKKIFNYTYDLFKKNKELEISIKKLKDDYYRLNTKCLEHINRVFDYKKELDNIKKSKEEEDTNKCCICMESPREYIYVNCGHLCGCYECCTRIGNNCPICRQEGKFIKVINV